MRTDSASTSRAATTYWVGLLACALLFLLSSGTFLPHQSLWVDETTQLSGLALDPAALLHWLTGGGPDLGVPPDRMPPGAYLLGQAWSSAAGLSETGMRWFGTVCTVIALGFVGMTGERAFGRLAGVLAALLFALSPNVLLTSVEIRAYPVFLMFSAIALYCFVRVVQAEGAPRSRWLGALTVALVLAAFTHFFGVVLATAVGAALLLDALLQRKPLGPILIAAVVCGALCVGLVPFVRSAVTVSGPVGEAGPIGFGWVTQVARLIYRLYGHPALATSTAVTVVASLGFLLAIAVGATAPSAASTASRRGLLATVLCGLAIVCVATLVVRSFGAASSSYNIWLLPPVSILAARAACVRTRGWRTAGIVGFALLAGGSAFATLQIHRYADAYAHGPQKRVIALVRELGPEQVDVVYDIGPDDGFGLVVFALRYTFGRALPQYTYGLGAPRFAAFDTQDHLPPAPSRAVVVVVRAASTVSAEVARRLQQPVLAAPAPTPAAEALQGQGWRLASHETYIGMMSGDIEVLRRP